MANTKIQSEQIQDGAITAAKIADGAIVAAELADNSVTTAKINADAVTGAKIADDAINSEHYTDGSIDTAHIADANITTAKIADDAVTSAKLDTNITVAGTLASTGALTANAGVVVDNITIDGTEIDLSSGDLTLDVAGDIILDADGDNINFKAGGVDIASFAMSPTSSALELDASGDLTLDVAGDIILDADGGDVKFSDGGTNIGNFVNSSSDFAIEAMVQDKDIIFKGDDGGSGITALTLDMSEAGKATFNDAVIADSFETTAGGTFTTASGNDLNIVYPDTRSLFIKENTTTHFTLDNVGNATIHNGRLDIGGSGTAHANTDDLIVGSYSGNHGIQINAANTGNSAIFFGDDDSTIIGQLEYVHASDYLVIITGLGQRLRIDSHGVKFNTNTAETDALDDYEEGSWTIAVSSSDPGSMTATPSNAYGWYVKVGKVVHVGGSFDLSVSNGQGTMRITGLPYACSSNGTRPLFTGQVGYTINVVPQPGYITIGNGSTADYIDVWREGNNTRYNIVDWDSGGRMNFQITYEAN